MGDLARMQKHFEEIDEYMADKVRIVADLHPRTAQFLADIDQIRADGYPLFADELERVFAR